MILTLSAYAVGSPAGHSVGLRAPSVRTKYATVMRPTAQRSSVNVELGPHESRLRVGY